MFFRQFNAVSSSVLLISSMQFHALNTHRLSHEFDPRFSDRFIESVLSTPFSESILAIIHCSFRTKIKNDFGFEGKFSMIFKFY